MPKTIISMRRFRNVLTEAQDIAKANTDGDLDKPWKNPAIELIDLGVNGIKFVVFDNWEGADEDAYYTLEQ